MTNDGDWLISWKCDNMKLDGRSRVLGLLAGQAVDRTPVMPITMMFAADCLGVKYGAYASDFRILVEAQIKTANTYDFDYVSVISDPAREAADCGGKIAVFDDQPPAIDENAAILSDKTRLATLKHPDPHGGGRMHDRVKAAALFKQRVSDKLIEGWVEGPCALGADFRGINAMMLDFYDDESFIRDLFEWCVETEIRFARAQIEAGADLIGVGDAAASLVGPEIYHDFVWPMEKKLIDAIHLAGAKVRLHICGNTRPLLAEIGKLGCDIVDLDYFSPVAEARSAIGTRQVLLGNIHPVAVLRNGTASQVKAAIQQCMHEGGTNYIIGAGCEVPRDTSPENVRVMRECSTPL
jgi:MtaA/CmuA family methyltransferase